MSKYDKVKLSELIIQKTDTEQIVDMENEHYITLSLYGKGARERVIKDGKYPVPFTGYRVSEGQFIYSRIDARNGAYDIIGPELDGFVVSKDFPVFDINESRVLPHFLRRAVLSDAFINQVKNSSFGATNRMRIKEDIFAGYSIPLPKLSKQKEIVDILDRVETIINSRQQELQKLDDLIKARFIEMFGDPILNSKHLETNDLKEVLTLKAGDFTASSDISDEPSETNPYPCYGGNGIRGYVADYNQEGEYSLVGRQGALSGNVQFASGKFKNTEHALLVTPIMEMNSIWLNQLLQNLDLKRYQTGAAQPGLSVKNLQYIQIICVPIDEQKRFAEFIVKINKSKLLEARQAGFIAKTGQQISFCR